MEGGGGFWTDTGKLKQIQNRFGSLSGQLVPRVEAAALDQFEYLTRSCFTDAGNFLKTRRAFLFRNFFHRRGPGFDRFGGHAIRAYAERIFAANLHQAGHAIEPVGDCFVVHWQVNRKS